MTATTDIAHRVSRRQAAPDFTLPAVDGSGTISLAGLSRQEPAVPCAVRRAVVPLLPARRSPQMAATEAELKASGVETLVSWPPPPENARLYFKFRPTRLRLAADPELDDPPRLSACPSPNPTPELHEGAARQSASIRTAIFPNRCRSSRPPRPSRSSTAMPRTHDRPGRHGAAMAAAQGPVPDRPRRHRALGQHRMRRGPDRVSESSPRAMRFRARPGRWQTSAGDALDPWPRACPASSVEYAGVVAFHAAGSSIAPEAVSRRVLDPGGLVGVEVAEPPPLRVDENHKRSQRCHQLSLTRRNARCTRPGQPSKHSLTLNFQRTGTVLRICAAIDRRLRIDVHRKGSPRQEDACETACRVCVRAYQAPLRAPSSTCVRTTTSLPLAALKARDSPFADRCNCLP